MKTAHKLLALLLTLAMLMALAPAVLAEDIVDVTDMTGGEAAGPVEDGTAQATVPSSTGNGEEPDSDIIDIGADEASLPDGADDMTGDALSITDSYDAVSMDAGYIVRISGEPSDYTGAAGGTAKFTVSARGIGLSYSWQYSTNGGATWQRAYLGGSSQTDSTLSVTIYEHRAGYRFRCVVSDIFGNSVTSSAAVLHVVKEIRLLRQPTDISAAAGDLVAFSLEADGDGLSYQWQFKSVEGSWSNVLISSYDTAVLVVSATTGIDGYQFRCAVTDENGSTAVSDVATLTVGQARANVRFTSQPSDASAIEGETATFTVAVSGSVSAYQWQYRLSSGSAWNNVLQDGEDTAALTVDVESALDDSEFRCVVTDGDGNTAASAAASLAILSADDAAVITTDPKDVTVEANKNAIFTIVAEGEISAYQWQFSVDGGVTWLNVRTSGYNTATLTVTTYAFYDGYQFRCTVTDQLGNTVSSAAAVLHIASADAGVSDGSGTSDTQSEDAASLPVLELELLSDPEDVTVYVGDKATFSVEALGDELTYQWKVSRDDGVSWTAIKSGSGYNTDTLTFTASLAYSDCLFRCVVTDESGNSAISKTARLTVLSPSVGVEITEQPESVTAASGAAAVFTITVSGKDVTYCWQFSADAKTWQDSAFNGYDTDTLTVTATAALNGYYYRCVVTASDGSSVTSDTAQLTVKSQSSGTVYYVSATGTSSTGTSPSAPMSLETANSLSYYNGDQILLKCGDVFYGQLSPLMRGDGSDGKLVISCYGEGDLPVITTAKLITSSSAWSQYSTNIWRASLKDTSKFSGYKATDADSCNVGHIKAANGTIFGGLCTSRSKMSSEMDFYCDGTYIYVYTSSNPYSTYGTLTLAINVCPLLVPNYSDVSCLHICSSGGHGVHNRMYPMVSASIHDLVVDEVGGALQYGVGNSDSTRYGNGIEIWGNSSSKLNTDISIYNNIVEDAYDSGITVQGNNGAYSDIDIYSNIIIRCSGSFEFWTHGSNDTMSISVYNNYCVQAGGGWSDYYRDSRWFGDFTFAKFASGTSPQITFTGNVSIDPFRIFQFTTALPSGQKITWSGNTVYTGDSLVYYATHGTNHLYSLSDALSLYETMSTWTGYTLTSAQQSKLDNASVLYSNDYSAIRSFLVSNF